MRPPVTGSCTRVDEPTGEITGGLEIRQGGMSGVSFGDICLLFYVLLGCREPFVSPGGLL